MYHGSVPNPYGRKPVLLTGTFGRLTATPGYQLLPRPDGRNRVHQLFACECGENVWVVPHRVRSGNTNSCGCLHRERAADANRTHGESHGVRLYRIWKAINRRCRVPEASNYKWYGGRGISLCDGWRTYSVFRDWALDNGYDDDLEIDRVDNDGDYEPTNCQWISKVENVRKARADSSPPEMVGGDATQ